MKTALVTGVEEVVSEIPVTKTGIAYVTPQVDLENLGKNINRNIGANGYMDAEELEEFWKKYLPTEFEAKSE
jgi:hypothetical protein